ncbi:MAG: hypothetical protein NTW21_40480 [Verrucomicrobia bacterium]|nr:hypothetical protein [Verrucomicrobiota bacterium]
MKSSAIPLTCCLTLAALSGAVLSHWWSLREFGTAASNAPRPALARSPVSTPVTQPTSFPDAKVLASQPPPAPAPAPAPIPATAAAPSAAQREFFESLLDEMKQLKQANLALRDHIAETNRDLMKLEFRVDTHSESFRPLPVTEEEATLDTMAPSDGPGVLPPRPDLVGTPEIE